MPFLKGQLKEMSFPLANPVFFLLRFISATSNIQFSPVNFNFLLKTVLMASFDTFPIHF